MVVPQWARPLTSSTACRCLVFSHRPDLQHMAAAHWAGGINAQHGVVSHLSGIRVCDAADGNAPSARISDHLHPIAQQLQCP